MLRARLSEALKDAMRGKEQLVVSTIRMILAGLKDRDIAARTRGTQDGVDEAEILQLLQAMVKQRQESATLYDQGGRAELAAREREEVTIIQRFLPDQLDEAGARSVVVEAIAATEASGIKEIGRVMAWLREHRAGQMDFALASRLARELLG